AKIGGIIEGFEPETIITDRAGRRLLRMADWLQTMGLCGAELAYADAGLSAGNVDPARLGVHFGAGRGGADVSEKILTLMLGAADAWRRQSFASPDEAHGEVTRDVATVL